MQLNNLDNIL